MKIDREPNDVHRSCHGQDWTGRSPIDTGAKPGHAMLHDMGTTLLCVIIFYHF